MEAESKMYDTLLVQAGVSYMYNRNAGICAMCLVMTIQKPGLFIKYPTC